MEQCLEFFITFVKTNIKLGLYNYHMPTFFMVPMLILVIYLDIKEIYFVLLAVECQPLAINMQNLWCTYLGLKYNPPVALATFSMKKGMNFIVYRVCCFWSNSLKLKVSLFQKDFLLSSILPKNERKISTWLLWFLRPTCFPLFFGRIWRHQKDISKLIDL